MQRSAEKQDRFGEEKDLTPLPSGLGIQICEPVATDGDAALADFGSGCGLWLQWAMGFHPELGKTPRWELAGRARNELKMPRLRLSLAQGAGLASILGVTHIAVGQIGGTAEKCLLTYQLYAMPSRKAVGAPIHLSGSLEQVVARLPEAARALLAGLGVHAPRVPTSVGVTPPEMALLGRYGVAADSTTTQADQVQIDALSQKLPLATLLAFGHNPGHNSQGVEIAARRVVEQADGNFLMLGVVATIGASHSPDFARVMDEKIAALKAPNNAVLAYWPLAMARTQAESVRLARQIVRMAPASSNAWNTLAVHYGQQGESIRLARVFAGLSDGEAQTLVGIYAHWKQAASRATALDPSNPYAWHELAVAATFAGDPERADAALWKQYDLEKSDISFYTWGLEMYQPKWGGDPKNLAKVARLSTTAPLPLNAGFYNLGSQLKKLGFDAEAKIMFDRAILQARDWVRQLPNDSGFHALLGSYLSGGGQLKEAEAEFKTAVALDPASYLARAYLGFFYKNNRRYPEAIVQLREDVRLLRNANPQSSASLQAKTSLAEALLHDDTTLVFEEPERLLNEVLKAQPNWYQAHEDMGWLLAHRKQYDAAIASYTAAERLAPDNSIPYQEIGRIYRLQSKFEEAVREGERAAAMAPKFYTALAELAETYAAMENYAESEKRYRQATAAAPDYAPGHFGLGKLLLKMGKKDEARVELKRALELDPDPELKKSAQALLDSSS